MRELKVGQYMYVLHGRSYHIYRCDYNDGVRSKSNPVMEEPVFYDAELARRRVYELNGWNYKTRVK